MMHPAHDPSIPSTGDRIAEKVATFVGSWRFIIGQTVIVTAWVALNIAWLALRFDPYPFILLNLAFSTQAAYATPILLLAANRANAIAELRADIDHAHLTENTTMTQEIHAKVVGS